MPTRELFNAKSQQVEEAQLTVDFNNEIVATFEDGGIIKFPASLTDTEFEKLITLHQKRNIGQEVITDEMLELQAEERANSLALIGADEDQTNDNTMSDEDKTNDSDSSDNTTS